MSPAPKQRRAFYEILVEGQPERVHGLLTGLVLGSGSGARVDFAHDAGVKTPLGEKVLEFMHLHAAVCHVVADAAGQKLLKKHAKDFEKYGVRIMQDKRIRSARFEFEYHAYARKYAEEIAAVFAKLPKGLKIEGGKPEEKVNPDARGVEAYSPAHHYEVESAGAISSSQVDRIIRARRLLDEHPLVNVEPIELKLY